MNSIWAKDRAWTFYSVVSGFLECWNNKKPTKILIVARFLPMYFRIPNCHKINHDWVNLFEILLDLNISCSQQSVFTIAIHGPWSIMWRVTLNNFPNQFWIEILILSLTPMFPSPFIEICLVAALSTKILCH